MSTAERDEQMAFMEAQALAVEIQRLLTDKKIGVIAHALALTLGTFAATSGEEPAYVVRTVAEGAFVYMNDTPIDRTVN